MSRIKNLLKKYLKWLKNEFLFYQDKDEEGKPMGLGLSIVGGSDTLLGAIFIHEVYEAGYRLDFLVQCLGSAQSKVV